MDMSHVVVGGDEVVIEYLLKHVARLLILDMDSWCLRITIIQWEGENVATTSKEILFQDNCFFVK